MGTHKVCEKIFYFFFEIGGERKRVIHNVGVRSFYFFYFLFLIRDMLGLHISGVLKKRKNKIKFWLCEITFLPYISYSCSILIKRLNW